MLRQGVKGGPWGGPKNAGIFFTASGETPKKRLGSDFQTTPVAYTQRRLHLVWTSRLTVEERSRDASTFRVPSTDGATTWGKGGQGLLPVKCGDPVPIAWCGRGWTGTGTGTL